VNAGHRHAACLDSNSGSPEQGNALLLPNLAAHSSEDVAAQHEGSSLKRRC